MTFLQNQSSGVAINVLHDQGVPNTLRGVRPGVITVNEGSRSFVGLLAIAVVIAGLVGVAVVLFA